MAAARLYHNADCSKCRAALALLLERGVDVEVVNYLDNPLDADHLRALVRMLDVPAAALVRPNAQDPEVARLLDPSTADEAIHAALAANPRLLQRPILVVGERAVIARPPERVLELL